LRCTGAAGDDDLRMSVRQVIVATSLATHRSVGYSGDLRAAIDRFAGTAAR